MTKSFKTPSEDTLYDTRDSHQILGVILAGGNATRMGGGDKSLRKLGSHTILHEVCTRLQRQTPSIILNTNSDPALFSDFTYPIIDDQQWLQSGPLAGVLAGLHYAQAEGFNHILSIAADTPFFPANLLSSMLSTQKNTEAEIIFARSNEQAHPTFALWPVSIASKLQRWLQSTNRRSIRVFAQDHNTAYADFTITDPMTGLDPFFNINTPDDLAQANLAWEKFNNGTSNE